MAQSSTGKTKNQNKNKQTKKPNQLFILHTAYQQEKPE